MAAYLERRGGSASQAHQIHYSGETKLDRFHDFLRDIGSMEFKEDYCHFEELPRL
jgi:hypothetical protein